MAKKNKYEHFWKFTGSPWKTESAWFGYIRSALRKVWKNHPRKINFLNTKRKRIPNPNPKSSTRFPEIWGGVCECCQGEFPLSAGKKEGKQKVTLQVDHLTPAGSLIDVKDIQQFFENLILVTEADLRLICTDCHKSVTLAERLGISFEEAKCEKEAISIIKEKQDKIWLLDRGIMPASSQANRRKQITAKLREELK